MPSFLGSNLFSLFTQRLGSSIHHTTRMQLKKELSLRPVAIQFAPTKLRSNGNSNIALILGQRRFMISLIARQALSTFTVTIELSKIELFFKFQNFCSDICYHSSMHFKKQIPTSPLWARDEEEIPDFNILTTPSSGLKGDEVCIVSIVQPDEDDAEEEEGDGEKEQEKEKVVPEKQQPPPPPKFKTSYEPATPQPPIQVVFKSMEKWFTKQSLMWLRAENVPDAEPDKNENIEAPVKQLEQKLTALKVRAYFTGQLEYDVEEEEEVVVRETTASNPSEEESIPVVIPLVDVSAQKALRKRIVMNYLEKGYIP